MGVRWPLSLGTATYALDACASIVRMRVWGAF
jgi:hypothetical protein